jgi:aspartyl-tRNA synthetase
MERILALQTAEKVGETVTIKGWVEAKRDHGQLVFVDIRDRSGIVQVVGDREYRTLKPESVVEITGEVRSRSLETVNHELPTGKIEIKGTSLAVLNLAETLPFPIDTDGYEIDEGLRLKHRYLDLRRKRLQKNIKDRSRFVQLAREFLFSEDFVEIETPMLTKSTQEGSRDFLVPSRLNPGKFFALPQSPQQYKQLLMTAGFERYFQIARCIRDEDPRADRGYEHTQIDIEMSFATREDVMALDEAMITRVVEAMGATIASKPFPVLSYAEAVDRYGEDKFDMRTEEEKAQGKLAFAWVVDFPFFKRVDPTDAAEKEDGKSGWTFTHNPFSQPKEEFLTDHLAGNNIEQILTTQYDLVCNGYEVGGGSIRAHSPEVLIATYKIMGYSDQEIQERVGHMLQAFRIGTPPHGGLAHGVERLMMILNREEYLREVQAFPQTGKGNTSVMEAPAVVSPQKLQELYIKLDDSVHESVYDALIDLLNRAQVQYQLYQHEPAYTSEEAAGVRGDVDLHQGAKAMVLRVKDGHMLYVLPGDERADLKTVRAYLSYSNTKLESMDRLLEVTGLEAGAIPPFGSLMGMKTLISPTLGDNDEIVFSAGRHDRSIKMLYADFLKLERPEILK